MNEALAPTTIVPDLSYMPDAHANIHDVRDLQKFFAEKARDRHLQYQAKMKKK